MLCLLACLLACLGLFALACCLARSLTGWPEQRMQKNTKKQVHKSMEDLFLREISSQHGMEQRSQKAKGGLFLGAVLAKQHAFTSILRFPLTIHCGKGASWTTRTSHLIAVNMENTERQAALLGRIDGSGCTARLNAFDLSRSKNTQVQHQPCNP